MGEITEALRRARLEDEAARRGHESSPQRTEEDPHDTIDTQGPSIEAPLDDPEKADLPELPIADAIRVQQISTSRTGFWTPRALLIDPPLRKAECFRHFAVQVNRELVRRGARSVLVTSALPQEGKTTVSGNLALAIASMAGGDRTALVDLDLHRGAIRRGMGVSASVGFERVLSGEAPLEAARIATDVPGLDIYPVAQPLREAHGLLSGPHFQAAIELLESRYERVVCDAPPVLPVPDVALAADHVATCLVVTRRGITRRRSYQELLSIIPDAKIIGVFLNETRDFRRSKRYAYYDPEEDIEEPE
jgi:Mrp family chromosome partitioning ATPase